jgi:hypothetical protein
MFVVHCPDDPARHGPRNHFAFKLGEVTPVFGDEAVTT